MMKKVAFLAGLLLLLSVGFSHAQSNCSYVIVSTGGYSQAQIDQAFSGAKLDSYRQKTVRRPMRFTNGAEVHLLSATEMQQANCPVNGTLAMEDSAPLDPSRRFEIHPAGIIYEVTEASGK